MRTEYIKKLCALMKGEGVDAVMVAPSEELAFLGGFTPGSCERFQAMFFKADGSYFYFSNLLYAGEVQNAYKDVKVYTWFDGDYMTEKIKACFEKEGLLGKVIGVNSSAQAFNVIDIARATGCELRNAKPLLEEMRIHKTEAEIDGLRKAAAIADAAYSEVVKFIKAGMTEQDIKDFLVNSMLEKGGGSTFCIVASGPNSSYPHYHGSSRVIEKQDLIILDFGCTVGGLWSDMSRTVFVGGITDEQRKIYEIVLESNHAGEKAAVLGAHIPGVDKASRDVIEAAGHGGDFVNRLGHGIGFMIHEAPDIKGSNDRKLEAGMCFSVEPGIYMAGVYGMRIEDIVVVTDKGTEILNKSTHDIIITNN